jgi:Phosphodiester glycosidase
VLFPYFPPLLRSLLIALTFPIGLSTLALAQSQPSWQEWVKQNPTYRQSPVEPTTPLPDDTSPAPSFHIPGQPTGNSAVQVQSLSLLGARLYVARVDLTNPHALLTIGLPKGANRANSSRISYGQESFSGFVSRLQAAVVINGTFFGLDRDLPVMGNMVAGGQFLKYVPWEDYGTTLGISSGKRLEMVTTRLEGRPNWSNQWFSITAGPRLLRGGRTWLNPRGEGFTDRKVMGVARRAAIGYDARGEFIFLAAFLTPVSLNQEAAIMQALGCSEAMNLDGGSSLGLAYRGQTLVRPGRGLTNVIAVYDAQSPASNGLNNAWRRFNRGERQSLPKIF